MRSPRLGCADPSWDALIPLLLPGMMLSPGWDALTQAGMLLSRWDAHIPTGCTHPGWIHSSLSPQLGCAHPGWDDALIPVGMLSSRLGSHSGARELVPHRCRQPCPVLAWKATGGQAQRGWSQLKGTARPERSCFPWIFPQTKQV